MKKSISLLVPFLLLVIFPDASFSQQGQVKDVERQDLQDLGNSNVMRTKQATKTIGDPYLNPAFLKGEAIVSGGTPTQAMYLRFNTETNTVEVLRNEEIQVLDTDKIEGFRIYTEEEDVLFKNGFNTDIDDINRQTFLRVLYDGIHKFVAHHSASLKEDLPTYSSATQKNKYVSFLNYYIVTPDGTFNKTKLNKDDILNILSDKSQQIENFATTNDLSFDNEDDIEEIIREYDSITS